VATLLGACGVVLVGRLAARAGGTVAGGVAALLYALYPEAVSAERGPFLEPALNLLCLAFAWAWLAEGGEGRAARRGFWAGVLGGAALSVKVWAGAWGVAALLSLPRAERGRALGGLVVGAAAALGVLVVPLVLLSRGDFFTQTLLFHTWRPADGASGMARFRDIFPIGHRAASLLAGVGLLAVLARRGEPRTGRFFAAAWVLTLAGFFASSSYWRQYNAHLAASETVLAGLGAGALWGLLARSLDARTRWWRAVGLVGLGLGLLRPWKEVRQGAQQHEPPQQALAEAIRARVPAEACLLSMEPGWGVLGGRWPSAPAGQAPVVDTYAAQLLAATRGGGRYPSTQAAFLDERAQAPLRPLLEGCPFVASGWRGSWQLAPSSREALGARFRAVFSTPGAPAADAVDLWERAR
jgi:hypothetical protein